MKLAGAQIWVILKADTVSYTEPVWLSVSSSRYFCIASNLRDYLSNETLLNKMLGNLIIVGPSRFRQRVNEYVVFNFSLENSMIQLSAVI